ncbi:MAG: CaiB/BaiF CoA transferase family protein [Halobacteriales archaeon]
MTRKILEDVTVLDVTQWVTGGFATLMLANQGAEVIKIERPEVGDDIRHSGPPFIEGESPYYWAVNYGKKSVEVDLKTDEGRELMYELAAEADVFVENFRPGKIDDLGLGYEDIRAVNENIVYCSISAYGQTGPWSERPGYDLLVQAQSGVMSVTGEADGPPAKVGIALADLGTAMWAAFAMSNALYKQARTGEGEYIDLAMLDSMIPLLTKQAGKVFAGEEPQRMGTRDPLLAPNQAYEAADGYLIIASGNQPTWERLCEALDREDLVDDERFATNPDRLAHLDELEAELERTLADRPVDDWVEILSEYGVPAGAVNSVEEAMDQEQVQHRDVVTSLPHTAAGEQPVLEHPANYRNADSGFEAHAPLLGEHTREVLRSMGYGDEAVEDLFERGVVYESGLAESS